jgi:CDP-diacylglycerol pyrophosphatase
MNMKTETVDEALAWLEIQRVAIRVTGDGYFSCTEVDDDGDYVTYDDARAAIQMVITALTNTSGDDEAPVALEQDPAWDKANDIWDAWSKQEEGSDEILIIGWIAKAIIAERRARPQSAAVRDGEPTEEQVEAAMNVPVVGPRVSYVRAVLRAALRETKGA